MTLCLNIDTSKNWLHMKCFFSQDTISAIQSKIAVCAFINHSRYFH